MPKPTTNKPHPASDWTGRQVQYLSRARAVLKGIVPLLPTRRRTPAVPVVYFARSHGTKGPIKIGCSVNPRERIKDCGCALALLTTRPGGYQEEKRMHRLFDAERIPGTEWFRPSARLLAFAKNQQLPLIGEEPRRSSQMSLPL